MKWLAALLTPPALIAPAPTPAPAEAPAPTPAPAEAPAPTPAPRAACALDGVAHAAHCAVRAGEPAHVVAARTLRALAYADFAGLELNGPHTKAADRVSRKKQAAARLLLARAADALEAA